MGSLFDGIGGFPLATVHNGSEPLWASEIEAFPIEVTKTHFPNMLHVGDMFRDLSEEKKQLERRIAAIKESLADDENVRHRLSEIEATIEERAKNKDTYDDTIVRQMIECIRVYHDGRLEIIFGGGHEVEEHL